MVFNYYRDCLLSAKALDLVQFDYDSIRQVVSAEHLTTPDTWLVDPDEYEKNGRILRDSESPRMLAYSAKDRVLYATDGCNSCARHLPAKLESFSADQLKGFADENEIRPEFLEHLVRLMLQNPK
ncbi:MAG: hypothetical protein AUH86_02770 [Acidobacteria bacterium 13_1_40CM_4_58_4]|nr:MAG: hypothetical protein AUH86_02770 [Acidobacteria bacterium 13_1_40CM_4_58_4]